MIPDAVAVIKKYNMLPYGGKVVLGLSGGADSVCLLHVLLGLRAEYSLELAAVHVNHGIRGAEADADEAFVAELCEGLGIGLDVYRYNVPEEAARMRLTLEEAGRLLRYRSFEESLRGRTADRIAVAHNKNDNAETVMMRIFRGTGLKGLSGIPPVRGRIIRPLIETSRDEIEDFCRENNIAYRTDSTNLKNIYTRNIIRLELLPLAERITPAALTNISRMTRIIAEESEFLDSLAADALAKCRTGDRSLSIPLLSEYPEVLKRHVLRLFFLPHTKDNHDISYEHVSMALGVLQKQTGKTVCLPFGLTLARRYDELVIVEDGAGGFCYDLPLDTEVFIAERNLFVKASLKKPDINFENSCTKIFSCDKITKLCVTQKITRMPEGSFSPEGEKRFDREADGIIFGKHMCVRSRRPGDRIYVAGMGGHKKLKDYFIDSKTPRAERDLIPLVVCGGDVVWIMDEKNIVSDIYKAADEKKIYIQKWEARK